MAVAEAKITKELIVLLFYVPCPDLASAENLAKLLLQEKLIACANIVPDMKSIYWWEEKIESAAECVLILKTIKTATSQEVITKRIEQLHPNKVPCIIALPTLEVNESYRKWLEANINIGNQS